MAGEENRYPLRTVKNSGHDGGRDVFGFPDPEDLVRLG